MCVCVCVNIGGGAVGVCVCMCLYVCEHWGMGCVCEPWGGGNGHVCVSDPYLPMAFFQSLGARLRYLSAHMALTRKAYSSATRPCVPSGLSLWSYK